MKTIHVVAAVITEGNQIFTACRGYGEFKAWIPEIRNESFDRVCPIIYFQEQPTAV